MVERMQRVDVRKYASIQSALGVDHIVYIRHGPKNDECTIISEVIGME